MILIHPLFITFPYEKVIIEKTSHKYLHLYKDLSLYEIWSFYFSKIFEYLNEYIFLFRIKVIVFFY